MTAEPRDGIVSRRGCTRSHAAAFRPAVDRLTSFGRPRTSTATPESDESTVTREVPKFVSRIVRCTPDVTIRRAGEALSDTTGRPRDDATGAVATAASAAVAMRATRSVTGRSR